jgi:NADH-quinone oxidoreductase subunit I
MKSLKAFFVKVLFIELWKGLLVTERYQWKKKFTMQYPEELPDIPPRFRGRLIVDMPLCISCKLCEIACPTNVITVIKNPDKTKKEPLEFTIDHGRCSFCGFCVDACPTDCILHHEEYELAAYSYDDLYHHKELAGRKWSEAGQFQLDAQAAASVFTERPPREDGGTTAAA